MLKMIGHAECGGHEIGDASSNEDWHTEHTRGTLVTDSPETLPGRTSSVVPAACQPQTSDRGGFFFYLSLPLSELFFYLTRSFLPQLISALIRGTRRE